ncbi:hypothetical protein [Paenibacillus spongiae]|nr:hypothetical protein [Paenibacillus spongiae]
MFIASYTGNQNPLYDYGGIPYNGKHPQRTPAQMPATRRGLA